MTITKQDYDIIKRAALMTAPDLSPTFNRIEEKEKERSAKTSAYILEKRKINKFYCR